MTAIKELATKWMEDANNDNAGALRLALEEFKKDSKLRSEHMWPAFECYISAELHDYRYNLRMSVIHGSRDSDDASHAGQVKGTSGEQYAMKSQFADPLDIPLRNGTFIRNATFRQIVEDALQYKGNLRGNHLNFHYNYYLATKFKEKNAELDALAPKVLSRRVAWDCLNKAQVASKSFLEQEFKWLEGLLVEPEPRPQPRARRTRKTVQPEAVV